jgi:hypothetical protein
MQINGVSPSFVAINESYLDIIAQGAFLENVSEIKLNDVHNLSYSIINPSSLRIFGPIPQGAVVKGDNKLVFVSNDTAISEKILFGISRPTPTIIKKYSKSESISSTTDKTSIQVFNDEVTELEVKGFDFDYVDRIQVGDLEISNFSVISPSIVKFTLPRYSKPGSHNVILSTLGVRSNIILKAVVKSKLPNIRSISTDVIYSGKSKEIIITGDGLMDPSLSVSLNGKNLGYNIIGVETISISFLEEKIGPVDINLVNSSGSFSNGSLLRVSRTPIFSSVSPNKIGGSSPTEVQIIGDNLDLIDSVYSELTESINILSKTKTSLVLTLNLTQVNLSGFYDLVFSVLDDSFIFEDCLQFFGPPAINSVYPSTFAANRDPSITITGEGFIPDLTQVTIGTQAALGVEVSPDGTQARVFLPQIVAGTADVDVQTPFGEEILTNGFTSQGSFPVGASQFTPFGNVTPTSTSIWPVSIDRNQDNVPDSWDRLYFPANQVGMIDHRITDSNANGHNNLTEYVFGTNPVTYHLPYNGTFSLASNVFTFFFETYIGRLYTPETGNVTLGFRPVGGQPITGDGVPRQVAFSMIGIPGNFQVRLRVQKWSPPPIISRITPSEVNITGGQISISGDYLASTSGIFLNGSGINMASNRILVDSENGVRLNVPASSSTGPVNLQLFTAYGDRLVTNAFNYIGGTPNMSSIVPSSGFVSTPVNAIISGTNLNVVNSVKFGTTSTSQISSKTNTSFTVAVPERASAATSAISLVNTQGQEFTTNYSFTYIDAPDVTGVSPTIGQRFTNQTVSLLGRNLSTTSSVQISSGGSPTNLNISIISNNQVNATIPNTFGAGIYTLTLNGTVQGVTKSDSVLFTIPEPLSISQVTPTLLSSGLNLPLTIAGSGFSAAGATNPNLTVRINNQSCTIDSIIGSSTLMVTTPKLPTGVYNVVINNGTEQVQSAQQLNVINFLPQYTMPTLPSENRTTFISSTLNTVYTTHQ